jgi:hypothetical protein
MLIFFLWNEMKQMGWKRNQLWYLSYYKLSSLQCIGIVEENNFQKAVGKII